MSKFDKIILWAEGKKSYFASIALLVIPFLAQQGIITNELASLLAGVVAILVGGGKYISNTAVYNGSTLGSKIQAKRK